MPTLRTLLPTMLLASLPGLSQVFSTSNAQLLHGRGFRDRLTGAHVTQGGLTTLTLEHFTAGKTGSLFAFVDLSQGHLADFEGQPRNRRTLAYGEFSSRLSLSNLVGLRGGLIKETYLVGELNQGEDGFRAWLYGLGVDFELPGFQLASLNLLARKDSFNRGTWQATAAWSRPFRLGTLQCSFEGFADLGGTDRDGTDLLAQPQLLVDLGPWCGLKSQRVWAGFELYLHTNRTVAERNVQALVKLILH